MEESALAKAFVQHTAHQSQTVIVADVARGSTELIQKLAQSGNVVGSGYGNYKEKQIRIANFPAVNLEQTQHLIQVLQGLET
jgi:phosphoserine aminotransferase